MALILSGTLDTGYLEDKFNASNIKLNIRHEVLSAPYEIKRIATIETEIINIKEITKIKGDIEELAGKQITIIFIPGTFLDSLYISKESWNEIRDYGILPGQYVVTLKLKTIKYNSHKIEIFPKRDVKI